MKVDNVIESIKSALVGYHHTNGENPDVIFMSTALTDLIYGADEPDREGVHTIAARCFCGIRVEEFSSPFEQYYLAITGRIYYED